MVRSPGLTGRWEIITPRLSQRNNLGDEHAWTLVAKSWKVAQSIPSRKRNQRAHSSRPVEGAERQFVSNALWKIVAESIEFL